MTKRNKLALETFRGMYICLRIAHTHINDTKLFFVSKESKSLLKTSFWDIQLMAYYMLLFIVMISLALHKHF